MEHICIGKQKEYPCTQCEITKLEDEKKALKEALKVALQWLIGSSAPMEYIADALRKVNETLEVHGMKVDTPKEADRGPDNG